MAFSMSRTQNGRLVSCSGNRPPVPAAAGWLGWPLIDNILSADRAAHA